MTRRQLIEEYYKHKFEMSPKEMFIKTIILRVISSFCTSLIVFALTGSWNISTTVLFIDFIFKTILYYAYEYAWFHFRDKEK